MGGLAPRRPPGLGRRVSAGRAAPAHSSAGPLCFSGGPGVGGGRCMGGGRQRTPSPGAGIGRRASRLTGASCNSRPASAVHP
ncbi:unnamed protein product [Rangifer tarandus platyrhynchus]|uniref:Uncharacterized protein n=2 Tax=Rangifer tarandus platyrhynchus TaxID=3082113 RepID=A0ABN8Z9U0_RANTA|nr:unnamed protein product [Rangifer tarandus platyrhynchus]CAI9704058.1 unnamed protein product [Rangifer tarandus platyrhynchus]